MKTFNPLLFCETLNYNVDTISKVYFALTGEIVKDCSEIQAILEEKKTEERFNSGGWVEVGSSYFNNGDAYKDSTLYVNNRGEYNIKTESCFGVGDVKGLLSDSDADLSKVDIKDEKTFYMAVKVALKIS